jgi:soluble lytic murein transglycosylase-like protein
LLTQSFAVLLVLYPLLLNAFCFEEAAQRYGVNQNLLRSIAKVESNNNPSAVNHNSNGSVDLGVMQINSSWIKPMGLDQGELLRNPCYNVMTGAKILKKCVDKHGYTWEAIGCYNAISPHVRVKYSWKVFNELNRGHAADNDLISRNNSSLHFAVRDISEERQ